jgi:hypothetical protein
MKLYDPLIQETLGLLQGQKLVALPLVSAWPALTSKPFIFPEEAAVELGGEEPSAYFIAYTSDSRFVKTDEAFLLGADLPDLTGNVPYAHLALILLDEEKELKDQELYRLLRAIEYARYHVFPEGFSLRVNTNELKEGGRLSKKAAEKGFSFRDLAVQFARAYHQDPHVRAVRQIFVTDPSFAYAKLRQLAGLDEGITLTLDHILKNLKMDCQTCSYKSICDTVEGMKELHQKERENSEAKDK